MRTARSLFHVRDTEGRYSGYCSVMLLPTSRSCAAVAWMIEGGTHYEQAEMQRRAIAAGIQAGAAQVLYEGEGMRATGVSSPTGGTIRSLRRADADLLYRWLCESLAAISEQPLPARPKCWEEVPG